MNAHSRRDWLRLAGSLTIASTTGIALALDPVAEKTRSGKLKLSLNAYSFHKPLSEGKMSLLDLLDFCSGQKLDGVDLTAYYFPGYPAVPSDEFLFELKRKAFLSGIDISGTGVRNDFANPDPAKREEDIERVKSWIVAAAKIGAPVIRIFSGHSKHEGHSREEVMSWMIRDIKECVAFGQRHGVVVAVQNHDDFLQTAEQTIELIRKIDSPWFGLILDIGSFRGPDPYGEIDRCIPYAVNWQIKELVYTGGVEEKVDLQRLFELIKASSYRGYLPVETLGPGDPFEKVPVFLEEVRVALSNG